MTAVLEEVKDGAIDDRDRKALDPLRTNPFGPKSPPSFVRKQTRLTFCGRPRNHGSMLLSLHAI
jgi:hypothetical protein